MAEGPIERGNAFKTGLECNLCDVHITLGQIGLSPLDSLEGQVFCKIIRGGSLKDSGEVKNAETKLAGKAFQGKGLITIFCNVITGLIHFVQKLR